ncbi:conserved hypothetical protein [Desulfamplus magnetovallimortis]|uniref:Calcineurin-like phosphoesterase domain-containing protein n=1 Tax=Desulfamplus magnetovallimortis TaxID=1246637 RepID=A0A1W1HFE4_9BACT|nr:metallophosphoesterase family protein [Desulfamplus magnetovallimortis]SLM31231.1 conserved hypothetical protein [Desulfamplus magnetovallimortis]
MRIAVFSDVHSNLEALSAFIEHSMTRNIHRYVCLGDIVGYGANPNQCIRLLQSIPDIFFVLGNHDNAAGSEIVAMNGDAGRAILWTKRRLTLQNTGFLKGMSENISLENLFFCHANPSGKSDWYYIAEKAYISRTFFRSRAKILFAGHTHAAAVITRKNFFCVYIRKPENGAVVPVASLNRQIFNCGSIGQPRDGDPRASYIIYDSEKSVVEFHRVEYDHKRAANKILAAGLPGLLADRLLTGS